jgi:DNA-binding MarR family transcriptional regulator
MGDSARTLFMLRVLQLELYNRMVERLLDFQVTPAQYMVMSLTGRHANYSSADFARRARTTPQSMNETIAALEKKKLIERSESPGNRRILHVRLTAAGARLLAKCEAAVDEIERAAFADLSARELKAFRGALAAGLARCSALDTVEPAEAD